MLSWIKYVVVSIAVIGLVIFSGYMTTQHTANTRTVAEVEGAIKTALLGESRGQGINSGISKEEFVSAVVASVVETQKNHGKTIKVDYVFLDSDGNVTEVDESIKSIQYGITVLGKDGKKQSVAEKHLSLDLFGDLTDSEDYSDIRTENIFFLQGERNRSKTVTLPGLQEVVEIKVDNGSVNHTVSGGSITVNVSNGNKKLVSGELEPEDTKYVQGQPTKEYADADGYVGTLTKYTVSGGDIDKLSKYVTNQPKELYEDSDGYTGILEKYVHSGELIPEEKKVVTGQVSQNYNVGGFRGVLSRYLYNTIQYPEEKKNAYVYLGEKMGLVTYIMESHGRIAAVYIDTDFDMGGTHNYSDADGFRGQLQIQAAENGNNCYPHAYQNLPAGARYQCAQAYNVSASGEVKKPGRTEYIYRYQGEVIKPEVDTRVQRYQGEVIKNGVTGEGYKYRGYVTKPKKDTREYEYMYSVTIKYK